MKDKKEFFKVSGVLALFFPIFVNIHLVAGEAKKNIEDIFQEIANKWNVEASLRNDLESPLAFKNSVAYEGSNFWEDYLFFIRDLGRFPSWIVRPHELKATVLLTGKSDRYLCAIPKGDYCLIVEDRETDFTSENNREKYRPLSLLYLPSYDIISAQFDPNESSLVIVNELSTFSFGQIYLGKIPKSSIKELSGIVKIIKTNEWGDKKVPLQKGSISFEDQRLFLEIEDVETFREPKQNNFSIPPIFESNIKTVVKTNWSKYLGTKFCVSDIWIEYDKKKFHPITFSCEQQNGQLMINLYFTENIVTHNIVMFRIRYPKKIIEENIEFTPEKIILFKNEKSNIIKEDKD